MRVLAVIPARWTSTRFPGKPLAKILGRSMVQWVWERTRRASRVNEVIIATDDERIARAVADFGARVEMTSSQLPSGTDRVAEVAARRIEFDVVLNVQGDEPLISPEVLDAVVQPLIASGELPVATALTSITDTNDYENRNVVKVVMDHKRNALYFSRAPIPFYAKGFNPKGTSEITAYRHLGIYGYQRTALLELSQLKPSPLELAEELEQLRFLEAGYVIHCVEVPPYGPGVDCPEDISKVETLLKQERK